MSVKSSRFSRMAYARRAALLAEDLSEWHQVYSLRSNTMDAWVLNASQRAALEERISELHSMVLRLQDIASELVALR